uniref:Twin-arginine translocation signal domain-containing protein n=1 Tax=Angiostrongylus cantonensis TaxID=6313 RepID=A0A0K0D1F4_ANGCA
MASTQRNFLQSTMLTSSNVLRQQSDTTGRRARLIRDFAVEGDQPQTSQVRPADQCIDRPMFLDAWSSQNGFNEHFTLRTLSSLTLCTLAFLT